MPLFKNDHSYEIGYETLIMSATGTQQLTLSMTPNNKLMPTTTWSSSDSAVATVDRATGIVTAVAAGIATISAAVDGKTISVDVAVMPTVKGQTFIDPLH